MLRVLAPGLLTTVQDLGRTGLQSRGIGPGGAIDPLSLRMANVLVGNAPGAAALELTIAGPALRLEADALVAIVGAPMDPAIDGAPLSDGRATLVRAGSELVFGQCATGCRAYLAVAGGLDVPEVLGSRSTSLRGHFGGLDGRALRAGDTLGIGAPSPEARRVMARLSTSGARWVADGARLWREVAARPRPDAPLRLMPGAESAALDEASRATLFAAPYRIASRSDRMGCRLDGPALALASRRELTSEAVTWGTVQLPPDGQPIILLADRQTTGGYPVIGHVATVDLPALAQRRPGDPVRFAAVTHAEAERLLLERERLVAAAAAALALHRQLQ